MTTFDVNVGKLKSCKLETWLKSEVHFLNQLSDANKQKTLLVLKSIVLYFIFRRFAMCRIFVFLVRSLEFLALFTKVLL